MSRETVGDEVRSGDLTVDALNTSVINPDGGDVGIGTSSPSSKLHVNGSLNAGTARLGQGTSTDAASLELGEDRTGDGVALVDFHSRSGSDYDFRILREPGANGNVLLQNVGTGAMSLQAGSVERMRIDNAGLITGSGTSLGAWTAYTPTLGGTGWAIGNGTATGWYVRIGKIVHFRVNLIFGSTSTYGAGGLNVSLPINYYGAHSPATGAAYDTSLAKYHALLATYGGGVVTVRGWTSATNGEVAVATTSFPFSWGSNDQVWLSGTYEIA